MNLRTITNRIAHGTVHHMNETDIAWRTTAVVFGTAVTLTISDPWFKVLCGAVTAAAGVITLMEFYLEGADCEAEDLRKQEERLSETVDMPPNRQFAAASGLQVGDVVHESGESFEVTSQPHTVDGMLAVPTNEDQHPEVLWFPRKAQAVITTRRDA